MKYEMNWKSRCLESIQKEKKEGLKYYLDRIGKQCWKCRTTTNLTGIHHVNGNMEDQKPQNLLRLCQKCHDLMQGICDKCAEQKDCFVQKLQRCWRFEDSLPPIDFKTKTENEYIDSHPNIPNKENNNNIIELVKLGHNIKTLMITETYLNSQEFLEHFVQCENCGDLVRWKLSDSMIRLMCSNCVQTMCEKPRSDKKRTQKQKQILS